MKDDTYSIIKTSHGEVVIEIRTANGRVITVRTNPTDFADAVFGLACRPCTLRERILKTS